MSARAKKSPLPRLPLTRIPLEKIPLEKIPPWTTLVPVFGVLLLVLTWNGHPGSVVLTIAGLLLIAAVLAAVHHAEVVAHKVGEPFGSLILAVAVTVIEVGLILMLMGEGTADTSGLARDTVFAAVMITLNGIVGISLMVGSWRHHLAYFNPEGTGGALATVISLATICLVLPRFTIGEPGPIFTGPQLAFAAVASLLLYGMFLFTQTVRHRDFFMPVTDHRADHAGSHEAEHHAHAEPPSAAAALVSLGMLLLALVAVVGLAKVETPAIEAAVNAAGFPHAAVGVAIALVVLMPESLAAARNAAADRTQISLNLAMGSAMASIGLTIPAIALASIWLPGDIALGLTSVQMVLLVVTVAVSILTVVPGRASRLQGGVHLVLLVAFLFTTIQP